MPRSESIQSGGVIVDVKGIIACLIIPHGVDSLFFRRRIIP
jgi:hypothetical protein